MKARLLAFTAALAMAAAVVGWALLPEPGPVRDRTVRVWDAVPARVDPLAAATGESCSATERVVLEKRHRVLGGSGSDGVAPTCKYVLHLQGWPEGEDECILEFPVQEIRALQATTLGSRMAETYYHHRQGGIMVFTGTTPGRSFISLDSRWCRWADVVEGIRAVPGGPTAGQ